ncbi:MAG: carboxylesterase family protein [Acidimicrobiales bacterium]
MVDGVVEVRGGRVQGTERGGVWAFSGIPYGAPTGGERRWRPPAPPEPWVGIRECDRFGPAAPQSPGTMEQALGGTLEEYSEDCLNLNLWTPGLDGGRRPVMVWVHGGSFMTGSGSGGLYRGGVLASEGDVVVVTINYRLGFLGFLAHPALDDPGQTWLDGAEWSGVGNWGLADQVAALAWVRDHIADFGGDPDNVTLFGESAGGMSVATLLAVPAAGGLFHRAIVESGPPYTCSPDLASDRAERLAAHLGVECTREALTKLPADVLVAAAGALSDVAGESESGLLVTPVVDGRFLPVPPIVAVASGSSAQVPLLIGTTRDESAFFVLGSPKLMSLDMEGLRHWMRRVDPDPEATDSVIAAVQTARAERGESVEPRDLWSAIATEVVFRVGTVRLADAHRAAAGTGVGTFCYLFTWESPAFGGVLGSCHALEIPFVFGTVKNPMVQGFSGGGDEALALSVSMRQAWTSFARTGVPVCDMAGAGSQPWQQWEIDRRPTTVLGPWPGSDGLVHPVDAPRVVELVAVDAVVGEYPGHRSN